MSNLNEVLDSKANEIAEEYIVRIEHLYNMLVREFGTDMKGIYNSCSASLFKEIVKPVCDYNKEVRRFDDPNPYTINKDKLILAANRYAISTILSWKDKITKKISVITDIVCHNLDGTSFYITGKYKENDIKIVQNMIVNVSSKGKLFNQFPTRIYINNKPISEAKFKQLTIV